MSGSANDPLRELRESIDEVDAELTRLFLRRMDLARAIGAYKRERNLPILDPERESRVLAARAAQAGDAEAGVLIERFFRALMELSREAQQAAPGAAKTAVEPAPPANEALADES